tara:strand:+ start:79 stop:315 length:237 start_codon:yes stop_codon:yes gene_type:complete
MIYYVLDIRDLDNVIYSNVMEDSNKTVRKNLANTEFLIKCNSDAIPRFISDGSIIPLSTLNYTEVISLMVTDVWSEEE